MNEPRDVESRLASLAERLASRPSLAASVMRRIEASEASDASGPRWFPSRIRRWMMGPVPRYAAVGLAAVVFLVAVLFFRSADLGPNVAFADVQAALRRIETAIIDVRLPHEPEQNYRAYLDRSRNAVRQEYGSKATVVCDGARGKILILNHGSKTAVVMEHEGLKEGLNEQTATQLDRLAKIDQEAVERLGTREFDGRSLVGFRVDVAENKNLRRVVWVDPATRLPVRGEDTPLDPTSAEAAVNRVVYSYTFNVPMEASLFSSEAIPKGYQVEENLAGRAVEQWVANPEKVDKTVASPTLDPLVGIGPARFGMNAKEVVQALGQPTRRQPQWDMPPDGRQAIDEFLKEAKEKHYDEAETQRRMEAVLRKHPIDTDKVPPSSVWLVYVARGYQVQVDNAEGLRSISCHGNRLDMRPFSGKTSKGVGIGSTLAQIEKAYGPPSVSIPGTGKFAGCHNVVYHALGLSVALENDKAVQITAVSRAAAERRAHRDAAGK